MKCKEVRNLSEEEIGGFLNSFDTVLVDCDGVLWIGSTPITGSPEVIRALRNLGKKVFYVTNNSTKHRKDFFNKCQKLNFGGNEEEVLGASYLLAWYLKNHNFKGKVYVLGSEGLGEELDDFGIPHIGIGPDVAPDKPFAVEVAIDLIKDLDPDVNCVIVAFDFHLSYPKILKAINYLERPNCLFLASNTDERFPVPPNVVPGTGTIVASVVTPAERLPIVVGKPNPYVFECVKERYPEITPQRTLMIGDRANTDILLGKNCGLQTLMVGTGVHSLENIRKWESSNDPNEQKLVANYYLDKLGDLLPFIEKAYPLTKT